MSEPAVARPGTAVIQFVRSDGVTQVQQALPGGGEFMIDLDEPVTVSKVSIHVELPVLAAPEAAPIAPEAGEDDGNYWDALGYDL